MRLKLTLEPDGMLLPPLCTQHEYVQHATGAGLEALSEPKDISKDVSKTWYVPTLPLDLLSLFEMWPLTGFPGTSRGRWCRTLRSGRLPSARAETGSRFCRPSAPCGEGMRMGVSGMRSCHL
jgi:hypothetical protein